MKIAVRVVLVLLGLFLLAFLVRVNLTHGHIEELLEIRLRVMERQTGEPLEGALLAAVMFRSMLEGKHFEWQLRDVVQMMEEEPEESWTYGWVCPGRTGAPAETTLRAAVRVTRWWLWSIEVSKSFYGPEVLLIEHPRYGRIVVPIDRDSEIVEGDVPDTWRLDLGTVWIPE